MKGPEQANGWRRNTDWWLQRPGGRDRGSDGIIDGYGVSFRGGENALELDGGDGFALLPMCSIPLHRAL